MGKINFKDPKVLKEIMNKIGMATIGTDSNMNLDAFDQNVYETLEKYIQGSG